MNLRSLLAPLTPVYRLGLSLRNRRLAIGREPIRRLRYPVLSIGNLSTGGSGKTPLAIALAQALTARGFQIDVFSRGYRRRSTTPARVDPHGAADDFGDEPLLIARQARVPVYVAQERYDAGLLAEQSALAHLALKGHASSPAEDPALKGHGFSRAENASDKDTALAPEGSLPAAPIPQVVHILDDGFQHRQLHRDIDILLLNPPDLQDRLLPAGNLREPLAALQRAHIVAIPAADPAFETTLRARGWQGPIWRLHRRMEIPPLPGPVLAFCGIARPGQFFSGLEQSGIPVAARRAFPDHHRYTQSDLDRLATQAKAAGATALLTTEKDAIRLQGLASPLPVRTVGLRTEVDDEPAALDWLASRISSADPH